MGVVSDLVKDVPIPRMVKARQLFDRTEIENAYQFTLDALNQGAYRGQIRPGMRIAVTAGSRGVNRIPEILKAVVDWLKGLGAEPFLVPAMGSHGGATAQGQLDLLASYGVTEESVGAPILSSMEVEKLHTFEDGMSVFMDKNAWGADGVIVVNRIKPHTGFRGTYESGLMKMMTIGLGKQHGAEGYHEKGFGELAKNVDRVGHAVLATGKVVLGLGIVENAYDRACRIVPMLPAEIPEKEAELLVLARNLMASILFPKLDILVVDQIGKDISGDGMDPNVTGRFGTPYADGGTDAERVVVLDISERSHGSGAGIGLADITTRRLFDKFDMEMTYPNIITSTLCNTARLPMVMANDREAIQCAIKTCAGADKQHLRIVRIKDTAHLEEIEISEDLIAQAKATPGIEVIGEPYELPFDENGGLF